MAFNFLGFSYSYSSSSSSSSSSFSSSSLNDVVEKDLIKQLEVRSYDASGLDLNLSLGPPGNTKTCSSCGVSSTPLWRNGPEGPKTLCNACGIRYRKEENKANIGLSLAPPINNMQGSERR